MSTDAKRTQTWIPTPGMQYLFKLQESGMFYGRVKLRGKSYRKSFGTSSLSVAKRVCERWLMTFERLEVKGSDTLGGMIELWRGWLAGEVLKRKITNSTVDYKNELLDSIRGWGTHQGTWHKFDSTKLEDLTEDMLSSWLLKHRAAYSATRTNGAVTVVREICVLAVKKKHMLEITWDRAAKGLVFVKVEHEQLTLPEPAQVEMLRTEIYTRCQKRGTLGGWLFDFLMFSGARIDSANNVHWEDVKWTEGSVFFRKAKRGAYRIPLFPQLRELLEKIKAQYPGAKLTDKVLPTTSIQTVMTSACRDLKMVHLSHHDLRHLFATRCIESGVDIPTISRWLGHKDGGWLPRNLGI
jgi:integrase